MEEIKQQSKVVSLPQGIENILDRSQLLVTNRTYAKAILTEGALSC